MWIGLILFTLLIQIISCLPSSNQLCDSKTEFDCISGPFKCIPLEWVCDNVPDCANGLDEERCNYAHSCDRGYMMCKSGMCIANEFKCDGEQDCTDNSDELHCEYKNDIRVNHRTVSTIVRAASACTDPRFRCSSGQCISGELVCNGHSDCIGGDDEENCQGPGSSRNTWLKNNNTVDGTPDKLSLEDCRPGYTPCLSGDVCVPDSFVCDGSDDCDDGSDESNCEKVLTTDEDAFDGHASIVAKCAVDGKYLCRLKIDETPVCINMNQTCNGIRDCPSGDDESTKCLECSHKGCEHSCINSPNGARCICQEGYTLGDDGITCVDEDECKTEGTKCQQFCEDLIGSYKCKCDIGYVLGDDGHECRLQEETDGLLFVSVGSELRHMPLYNSLSSSYSTMQRIGGHGLCRSMDYLHAIDKMFLGIIHQTDADMFGELAVSDKGLLRILRENVNGIGFVAVDWIGGNVFFTQSAPSKRLGITVCTMSGKFCSWIVKGKSDNPSKKVVLTQQYRGLVVNPLKGEIVWIDIYNGVNSIMMAKMDGSDVQIVANEKVHDPSGLAIDYIRNDIYFADNEMKLIERINLDSKERRVVVNNVQRPFDLLYFNGVIYWTEWGTTSLKSREVYGGHSAPITMHTFNRFPYGLAVNHSMYQPTPLTNPCIDFACPWICITVSEDSEQLKPKCICPDGYNYSTVEESCLPIKNFNETEGMSQISATLMREYCDADVACLNGGACKELRNSHERTHKIVCECVAPFEGEYCERLNPEELRLLEQNGSSIIFKILFVLFLIACAVGSIVYCFIRKPELANDVVQSTRLNVDRLTRKVEQTGQPVFDKLRTYIGNPSPSRKGGITSAHNVNFVEDEVIVTEERPAQDQRALCMESPSFPLQGYATTTNPNYDHVGGSSPVGGILRFENDSLL